MDLKKAGPKKTRVNVIQKEKRQHGLFFFLNNNDPVFLHPAFSGPYFGLDFF